MDVYIVLNKELCVDIWDIPVVENVFSDVPAAVEKDESAAAVGKATYPTILEFAYDCVELINVCARDEVVEINCVAIPCDVELSVENKYTLPVLYNVETKVLM